MQVNPERGRSRSCTFVHKSGAGAGRRDRPGRPLAFALRERYGRWRALMREATGA
jgi:hypothetical protein